MGARIRSVAVLIIVLIVGAILGTVLSQWIEAPRFDVVTVPVVVPRWEGPPVDVSVRNGNGRTGSAMEATGILRDAGFDVVDVGNYETFELETSFVEDHGGALADAQAIADHLGIAEVREAMPRPDENLYVDVTVVLGRDWTPESAPSPDDVSAPTPWWDLRRFLKRPSAPSSEESRLADPEIEQGNE